MTTLSTTTLKCTSNLDRSNTSRPKAVFVPDEVWTLTVTDSATTPYNLSTTAKGSSAFTTAEWFNDLSVWFTTP